MSKITPLPFSLCDCIPVNHIYVGMGKEFKTNLVLFEGYCSSSKSGSTWHKDGMLHGESEDVYYCVPKDSEIAKLNCERKKTMTEKQYLKKIEQMILSHGGIVKEHIHTNPTYTMITPLGEMHVTPIDTFIAIVFVGEPSFPRNYFGKNCEDFGWHSCKWNIQGVDRRGLTASEFRERMLKLLASKLNQVMSIPFPVAKS